LNRLSARKVLQHDVEEYRDWDGEDECGMEEGGGCTGCWCFGNWSGGLDFVMIPVGTREQET